jgi:pyruvate formate lyase activating enzyme
MDRLQDLAEPAAIVDAALGAGCASIAYTYNDPVIFAEYAIDTAKIARTRGVKNVAVTAGYITEEARGAFYEHLDAVNVDLKAFTERFYRKLCFAELGPVLDTLKFIRRETDVWLEVTTLLIPGENDDDDEIRRLSDWVAENLGTETPLHFSAFHADFKMTDTPPTPPETLTHARSIAKDRGLVHVYTGNVHDPEGQSTFCASCGAMVIERDWYRIGAYRLDEASQCTSCGAKLAGRFRGGKGDWNAGRRRLIIR